MRKFSDRGGAKDKGGAVLKPRISVVLDRRGPTVDRRSYTGPRATGFDSGPVRPLERDRRGRDQGSRGVRNPTVTGTGYSRVSGALRLPKQILLDRRTYLLPGRGLPSPPLPTVPVHVPKTDVHGVGVRPGRGLPRPSVSLGRR